MTFTPYEKVRNRIIIFFSILLIATIFNSKNTIIYSTFFFGASIILIISLWSYRNYCIYVEMDRLQLSKVIGTNIVVAANEINRIELESNKYGNWNWEMIYIFTQKNIYEYSISSFNQNNLLKALNGFCTTNNIILETKNYHQKRFDII